MINARALVFGNKKTKLMLKATPDDRPLGIQLAGAEEEMIRRAAEIIIRDYSFDLLDFNAACPVKKVVARGEGAALLRDPERLRRILSLLVALSPVPVTVKIRAGWDKDSVNGVEIARSAEEAGVQAIFIHGRTKAQGYDGTVDYQVIKAVKQNVAIPVIGSGDVFSAPQAKAMLDSTGCDGVAVARGSLGYPWIFAETAKFIDEGSLPEPPAPSAILAMMRYHFNLLVDTFGEETAILRFRKFFIWYSRGFRHAKGLRPVVMRVKRREELERLIEVLEKGERYSSA